MFQGNQKAKEEEKNELKRAIHVIIYEMCKETDLISSAFEWVVHAIQSEWMKSSILFHSSSFGTITIPLLLQFSLRTHSMAQTMDCLTQHPLIIFKAKEVKSIADVLVFL